MTQHTADDMNATIVAAEETVRRISQELQHMKTAAELLESAGQQSLHLQGAVDGLVSEISALVELSGRIIAGLDQLDVNSVVTDLKMTLMQRLDGLGAEIGNRVGQQVKAKDDEMLRALAAIHTELSQIRPPAERAANRKGITI